MKEALEKLALIRHDKRLAKQRWAAAWKRVQETEAYKEYQLYQKLVLHCERDEARWMNRLYERACKDLDAHIAEHWPAEIDLAQSYPVDVEIAQDLGHLVTVQTVLN